MKKSIFYTFLVLSFLVLSFSCSKDSCSKDHDNESSLNETGQKLIGKWYFADPSTNPIYNNHSFTFSTDGKVVYRYWPGGSSTDLDSENGIFTVDGDKMTMIFPGKVTLTYVQKVVFISSTKVKFIATGNPNEIPYYGTYYKAKNN